MKHLKPKFDDDQLTPRALKLSWRICLLIVIIRYNHNCIIDINVMGEIAAKLARLKRRGIHTCTHVYVITFMKLQLFLKNIINNRLIYNKDERIKKIQIKKSYFLNNILYIWKCYRRKFNSLIYLFFSLYIGIQNDIFQLINFK